MAIFNSYVTNYQRGTNSQMFQALIFLELPRQPAVEMFFHVFSSFCHGEVGLGQLEMHPRRSVSKHPKLVPPNKPNKLGG